MGTFPDALAEGVMRFSQILSGWFKELHPVQLGSDASVVDIERGERIAVFFTGGVDSFYSLLVHEPEITDLIFVHGFDVKLEDHQRRRDISAMLVRVGTALGKRVIEVETNARDVLKAYGAWSTHSHGLALASVAHALGCSFGKVYIASSFSEGDLFPWGSHPETDPLLGGALKLVHDGCDVTRAEKVVRISEHQVALDNLRICWVNQQGRYNCGQCEKCLRTMTSLYAAGRLNKSSTLPVNIEPGLIHSLVLGREAKAGRAFATENLRLLERFGHQKSPIYLAWHSVLMRPDWKNRLLVMYRKKSAFWRERWGRLWRALEK